MKDELNALKEEVEILNKKLAEFTDEELAQVSAGSDLPDGIIPLSWASTRYNLIEDLLNKAAKYRVRNSGEMIKELTDKINAVMLGQSIVTMEDNYSYLVFIYEDNDGSFIYNPGSLQVFKIGN